MSPPKPTPHTRTFDLRCTLNLRDLDFAALCTLRAHRACLPLLLLAGVLHFAQAIVDHHRGGLAVGFCYVRWCGVEAKVAVARWSSKWLLLLNPLVSRHAALAGDPG